MIIQRLSLENFRNYRHLDLELPPGLMVLFGPNASGKSNVLEAVDYLGHGRSYRGANEVQLLTWGQEWFRISARVIAGERSFTAQASFDSHSKRFTVDGVPVGRAAAPDGLASVVFSPGSLELVKGTPVARRRFLDSTISQLDPRYRRDLLAYYRVLSQRNALLRQIRDGLATDSLLEPWDQQLATLMAAVCRFRAAAVEKLESLVQPLYETLLEEPGAELRICYFPDGWSAEDAARGFPGEAVVHRLQKLRKQEIARGFTMIGPQRDELRFTLDGRDVQAFASQGQQRTVSLLLTLAVGSFIRQETGRCPVLLLDDVLSELDSAHREWLLDLVLGWPQAFLTCTSPGPELCRPDAQVSYFKVHAALVSPLGKTALGWS